jgi:hypothetical protein
MSRAPREKLAGTTQNDIVKEHLSRGTYIFAPGPSLRLTTDVIAWPLPPVRGGTAHASRPKRAGRPRTVAGADNLVRPGSDWLDHHGKVLFPSMSPGPVKSLKVTA